MSSSLVGKDVLEELAQTAFKAPQGAIIEVGVYLGGSALHLYQVAREQSRRLYLYDTFTGLPCKDEMDIMRVGDFSDASYEHVKFMFPEADVVKGVFPESAIPMEPIAFAHLDCDQYRSVRQSMLYIIPRMVHGGIMWFDDYGCLPGATRAVEELIPKSLLRQARCGKTYVVIDHTMYVPA